MNEQFSSTNPRNAVNPLSQTGNAAIVGAIIDTLGYAETTYVISTGAIVTGGATFVALLEHGNDPALADNAAVPAAALQGTAALAGFTGAGNQSFKLGVVHQKRYHRLTITPTGNTGAALVSAIALLGRPTTAPTPNPPV